MKLNFNEIKNKIQTSETFSKKINFLQMEPFEKVLNIGIYLKNSK